MEVGYKERLVSTFEPVVASLDDVIARVKSEEFSDVVNEIRRSDKTTGKALKREFLPAFFPSMVSGEPTPIVQIDIDPVEGASIDFAGIKRQVAQIEHCLYAFDSPSGGLKFAVVTDLDFSDCDLPELRAGKFKVAWDQAVEYLQGRITVPFEADRATRSCKQSCYLSHDPDCYFNPDAKPLLINKLCVVEPPKEYQHQSNEHPFEFLLELLQYIPKDLPYTERLPLNFSAMCMFGSAGRYAMENHWVAEKIEQQLNDQEKHMKYGHIGTLVNCAKKYGYQHVSGSARKHIEPKPTSQKLEPLVPREKASGEIEAAIEAFFTQKQSRFLNISTGAGKTDAVLNYIIRHLSPTAKVLILVPDHKLAEQICKKIQSIRTDELRKRNSGRGGFDVGQAVHIKGRSQACEEESIRETCAEQGVQVVGTICREGCMYKNQCAYTSQFWDKNPWANIRVSTHRDWSNEPSKWSKGCTYDEEGKFVARKGNWTPDYIIIDEDILKLTEKAGVATRSLYGEGLKAIVSKVTNGKGLKETVIESADLLRADKDWLSRTSKVAFATLDQFICDLKSSSPSYFELLVIEHLLDYVESEDEALLQQVFVDKSGIWIKKLPEAHPLYKDVPTLYLDATADEGFVRQVLGKVEFQRIAVQPKPEIRVFKLSNKTITKKWLGDPKNVRTLIRGLKKAAAPYQRVGLISYKSAEGHEDFSTLLGDQIGAIEVGHFGAVRGLNAFEDVDCLLIVGRYLIHQEVVQEIARIAYGVTDPAERDYADVLVRVAGAGAMVVNAMTSVHPIHRTINNHFSVSETSQAVGRARLIHGTPKDVFVFSNESFGTDIEVTWFFKWEDYFARSFVSDDVLERLVKRGYLRARESDLCVHLGISRDVLKKNRDAIFAELEEGGFAFFLVTCKDRHEKKVEWGFLALSQEKLQVGLNAEGIKVIGISEVKNLA
jgi:hypothetical protein